jgi:hypothetical protein
LAPDDSGEPVDFGLAVDVADSDLQELAGSDAFGQVETEAAVGAVLGVGDLATLACEAARVVAVLDDVDDTLA